MAMGVLKTVILILLILFVNFLNFLKQILSPLYEVLAGSRSPSILRTPEDRFNSLHLVGYNFSPNYVEFNAGCGVKLPRVHYLDEGPRHGKVILCLHGEPTWSFLYRTMIPPLVEAGYRVIVPDFIGFGKSDKYTSPRNYTHEMHTMVLRMLIDELHLQDIVMVCQDWGGLTGLSVVKDCPHLFSGLVVMNTGLPDPILNLDHGHQLRRLQQVSLCLSSLTLCSVSLLATLMTPHHSMKALPFTLWRGLVTLIGTWFPLSTLFKYSFKSHPQVSQEIINGYTAPFPTSLYCGGMASWPLLVPFYKSDPVTCHLCEAQNCLKTWKKPVLIAFGDSDPITRGWDKTFSKLIPHASNVVIKGAKHFLQETHGPEISGEIVRFLSPQKQRY